MLVALLAIEVRMRGRSCPSCSRVGAKVQPAIGGRAAGVIAIFNTTRLH